MPKRGPRCKIGYFKLFNYILRVLYTDMQWKELPIDKGPDGKPEIHYTVIYKRSASWSDDGSLSSFFVVSVKHLNDVGELDLSVLHGDGTNTVAKKGGDGHSTLASQVVIWLFLVCGRAYLAALDQGTAMARLVAIGDSLTQGFQSLAITATDMSYPAMIAERTGLLLPLIRVCAPHTGF